MIFDGRYRLVQLLGQGASAQVWLAKDTMTNNLRVAIKIFNAQQSELDSYGKQDFQKEFTTVYNINHQNLLTPTNYAVTDNVPYLVLPYCENGSVSSMTGRCDENDVVKLIHDVAAGLGYLHKHNVIHQDIKPDNIMLDDDLNYMVTDFGISTGRLDGSDTFGGTRAYMSPERFTGVSDAKGDVWALGATAYEMLTGNAPFGDHGGLVQAQGEAVPPIDRNDVSADLKKLIYSMLEPDADKRPSTDDVRRVTEQVLETGSWKPKSSGKSMKIGIIIIGLIVVVAGLFAWGKIRTKTYYYADYVEVNGAPVGIGSLTGSEHRARNLSYRIQTKGGRVTRVSLVNGHGKIVDYIDSENLGVRFPDQEYVYGANGRVDHMIARDPHGKVLYKFTYSDKGNTVSFQYDDEKNSPKFFAGTRTRQIADMDNPIQASTTSNIAHMFLEYDSDGRLVERQYLSLLKQPTPDANGAYGERYKYDAEGRVTEVIAIDRDGNAVSDATGAAIRRYKYDDEGNRVQVAFFTPDGDPAQEGHNIHMARLEYDEKGNLVKETYYNGNEDPVSGSTSGVFGYKYTYGDNGFRTSVTAIDADGEPMFATDGYVTTRYKDDGNGFNAVIELLDEDDEPVIGMINSQPVSVVRATYTETGLPLTVKYFDDEEKPQENSWGIAETRFTYDDEGNQLTAEYFDSEGQPRGEGAENSLVKSEYDNLGRGVSLANFDANDKPVANQSGVSRIAITYSPYGSVQQLDYYGVDGKPVDNSSGVSRFVYTYDDQGRLATEAVFNAKGEPVLNGDYSRAVFGYDLKSARLVLTQFYDTDGKLISTAHNVTDPATGKVSESWTVGPNGQLLAGTAKLCYTYNDMGNQTSVKAVDLNGRPVNVSLIESNDPADMFTGYELKAKYDAGGNMVEISYWDASGNPGQAADGAHRRTYKYDSRSRRTHVYSYTASGAPIGVGLNVPEAHIKYDNRSNIVESSAFDGHGNPIVNNMGIHRRVAAFDNRGNQTEESYFDASGKPVGNPQFYNCSRVVVSYNNIGNRLDEKYYTTDGNLAHVVKYGYNDKGTCNEQAMYDGKGNLDDSLAGFAKAEFKIAADGYTQESVKLYDKANHLVGTLKWDKKTQQWVQGPAVDTESSYSGSAQTSGGEPSWMADVKKQASTCPRQIMDGLVMRSITATNTSVTITIVMKNISGNNYDRAEVAEIGNDYAEFPHSYLGVPSSVACHVKVLNRDNKVIYSK